MLSFKEVLQLNHGDPPWIPLWPPCTAAARWCPQRSSRAFCPGNREHDTSTYFLHSPESSHTEWANNVACRGLEYEMHWVMVWTQFIYAIHCYSIKLRWASINNRKMLYYSIATHYSCKKYIECREISQTIWWLTDSRRSKWEKIQYYIHNDVYDMWYFNGNQICLKSLESLLLFLTCTAEKQSKFKQWK